jgi:queuine tRNA-ribosyltransferase
MGVGTPENILECIALGIDMFDCVMPTRNARNGMLFTTEGIINIRNEKWKDDLSPIDIALGGYASTFYSKAYLRHLIISKEILGAQIASIHNLTFYLWLVQQAREQILAGTFTSWKNQMVKRVSQSTRPLHIKTIFKHILFCSACIACHYLCDRFNREDG